MVRNIRCIVTSFVCAALAACGGNVASTTGSDGNALNLATSDGISATRLFSTDFKGVCSGASVSRAAAYTPGGTAHKALYFATYEDDLIDRSSSLPSDWTEQFSESPDNYTNVDLVVCARRTAAREVRMCDGFRVNGRETQNRVRWHTATYELSVREARTGREIAKTTAEATESDCPMFQSFQGESDTVDGYANLTDTQVADFLRPHMGR